MNPTYPFTAVEDQLLLALRDQGHYNWDLIKRHFPDRKVWALKQRHHMLHQGFNRMEPRGKRGLLTLRRWKMLPFRYRPWTPKDDYELQKLHFKGNDWLQISYAFPPWNAPECLTRWLRINPAARYPFDTEMDIHWIHDAVKNLEQAKCRKYWFSTRWRGFIYWFPDGRNFRDRPEYEQQKARGKAEEDRRRKRNRKRIRREEARERERVRARELLDAGEARYLLEQMEEEKYGGLHACERQLVRP